MTKFKSKSSAFAILAAAALFSGPAAWAEVSVLQCGFSAAPNGVRLNLSGDSIRSLKPDGAISLEGSEFASVQAEIKRCSIKEMKQGIFAVLEYFTPPAGTSSRTRAWVYEVVRLKDARGSLEPKTAFAQAIAEFQAKKGAQPPSKPSQAIRWESRKDSLYLSVSDYGAPAKADESLWYRYSPQSGQFISVDPPAAK